MDFTDYGANQAMIDSTLAKLTPGDIFDDLIVTNFGFCFGSLEHARRYSRTNNKVLSLITTKVLDIPKQKIQRREYLEASPIDPLVNTSYEIKPFTPEKSNWTDVVKGIWGDFENYHKHGSGIGIFDNHIQVAEAMVGFPGKKDWGGDKFVGRIINSI